MANHVSALKRARQTERKTAVNRANTSQMRTVLRKFKTSLAGGNQSEAEQQLSAVVSALDKSAKKGVIHKNTASRYKSRLTARVKALGSK